MSFNLSAILRESAAAFPDKPVVFFDGGSLTYRQLDIESERVAAGLVHRGIVPGDAVGLQLPNVPDFLVTYFGILKAGAVVVPMNVLLKGPEVAYYLRSSGARLLVTFGPIAQEALAGAKDAGVGAVYAMSVGESLPEGVAPLTRLADVVPEGERIFVSRNPMDTAVICYTSGTTGLPKGAELSHFQLYMNADIPGRLFGIVPEDVVVTVLPLFHIFALSSILHICVRFGGSMVLIPRFNSTAVLEAVQRHRATIFDGVPTMFIDLLGQEDLDTYDLSSLRVAISGGAAIPADVMQHFEDRFGVVILEGYGMSETASTVSFNLSVDDRKAYSVGKPIWGTEVQIWDSQNRSLAPGRDQVGELVVRGYNVMKGYHNRPEETEEAFTGEWFHTGDLGYVDKDGFLFIVDRKKELIIRGGYNVYPREVEEVFYTHPAVFEVAVLGVADLRLGEEVVAYVSLKEGAEATPEELVDYARSRLAAYKYPRSVEVRKDLPKGSTGKILKDQLRSEAEEARLSASAGAE